MIDLIKPEVPNFANYCIQRGAKIVELIIPTEDQAWPGLCNPSILDDNGQFKLVLRNVSYVMHASYFEYKNWSEWGPLLYNTPQEDHAGRYLKTRNYLCTVNPDAGITDYNLVNTSKYDKPPKWEFVGHEDARLVRWDDKLYMTGVRRDDNPDGVGRMSLCAIDDKYNEVSRKKIDRSDFNYCEKNWMAILDMPYCYMRTSCPTEIVKVDPRTGDCETILHKEQDINVGHDMMLRGSSQVIPWKDGKHIALVHTCTLWLNEQGRKYARYHFHFIVWDKDWNIEAISKLFCFNDFLIEFSNGLAYRDGNFYIPFALQDNMSFLMTVDEQTIEEFIYNKPVINKTRLIPNTELYNFFINDKSPDALFNLAMKYYNMNFKAGAYCLFQRAADFEEDRDRLYELVFWTARAVADIGHRDANELGLWFKCLDIDSERPEAYEAIHCFYAYRNIYNESYSYAKLAYDKAYNASFFYDESVYAFEYWISGLYNEHREDHLRWIEEHKNEYPNIYAAAQDIIADQKLERIL